MEFVGSDTIRSDSQDLDTLICKCRGKSAVTVLVCDNSGEIRDLGEKKRRLETYFC